jgi:hypothetical protein
MLPILADAGILCQVKNLLMLDTPVAESSPILFLFLAWESVESMNGQLIARIKGVVFQWRHRLIIVHCRNPLDVTSRIHMVLKRDGYQTIQSQGVYRLLCRVLLPNFQQAPRHASALQDKTPGPHRNHG